MLTKVLLLLLFFSSTMTHPSLVIKNWDEYTNEEINPLEPTPLRKLQIYVRDTNGGEYKLFQPGPVEPKRKRGSLLDNLANIGYYYK